MWNAAAKPLVEKGDLVVLGVVQEQHAERARLYKQWQQYEFPIVQDSITGLGLAVVPIPILLDEHGIVMETRLRRPSSLAALVEQESKTPTNAAPKLNAEHVTVAWLEANTKADNSVESKIALADAHLREATTSSLAKAVKLYGKVRTEVQDDRTMIGLVEFRLGVAHRAMFDLTDGEKEKAAFSKASAHWSNALEANPNQYIWRRRIQQYGPRQIKPYPFYDWVEQAIQEVEARGETPVKLTVPLSGAEIAQRSGKRFESTADNDDNPDPDARITIDTSMVDVQSTVVPSRAKPGNAVRVHVRFELGKGKWNNESEEMMVWINDSEHGTRSKTRSVIANPKEAVSSESRGIEFEFQTNGDVSQSIELNGYALVNVCENESGQCLYRRVEFTVPIEIKP